MSEWQASYFLDDTNNSKPTNTKNASLNESLQTQYIDIDERDDSVLAHAVRAISSCVGSFCTPKQVLGLLRVLKAVTLSFLVLSILANFMYILFVEILTSDEVKAVSGGSRDIILRLYGFALSLLGLAIELDYTKVVKKFSGMKGFLPRAVLYFFISQIISAHPAAFKRLNDSNVNDYQVNNNGNDDAAAANDDGNDANNAYSAAYDNTDTNTFPIPTSAIGFQRVTSMVLGFCALGYLICGLLCIDRFTARAFLSTSYPRITTALPPTQQVSTNSTGRPTSDADTDPPLENSGTNVSDTA